MGQGEGAVTVKPNDPGLRDLPAGNGESRSPEELERDADRIRNRMDETITEIEHRLSPDRLIDAAFAQVREGAGAFAVNLTQTLQRNPLPAVLMAAGVGWLLLGERGDKAARSTGKAESGHSRDAFEASP